LIVEPDPLADPCAGLCSPAPGMQIDAFLYE
jgi:hypothetical protein